MYQRSYLIALLINQFDYTKCNQAIVLEMRSIMTDIRKEINEVTTNEATTGKTSSWDKLSGDNIARMVECGAGIIIAGIFAACCKSAYIEKGDFKLNLTSKT